jgi:hypothetical protein
VAKTLFPVVRRGQLVRATSVATKQAQTLDLDQSAVALRRLTETAPHTLVAIQDAMIEALPNRSVKLLEDHRAELSPGGQPPGLGVIYNYAEFAIELDGATIIVRPSVTLCIRPPADIELVLGQPFSKFWTRFILVTHPESQEDGHIAANLSDDVLRAFDNDCARLHAAAVGTIQPIYGKALGEALGQALSLDSENNGRFEVLTVGSRSEDVPELFEAASGGASLTGQVELGDEAAERLFRLAMPTLARDPGIGTVEALKMFREDDTYQFLIYQSPSQADKGLFVARVHDKTARFVGLAVADHEARWPDLKLGFGEAHHAAANVVSAGLIAQYARQF